MTSRLDESIKATLDDVFVLQLRLHELLDDLRVLKMQLEVFEANRRARAIDQERAQVLKTSRIGLGKTIGDRPAGA